MPQGIRVSFCVPIDVAEMLINPTRMKTGFASQIWFHERFDAKKKGRVGGEARHL